MKVSILIPSHNEEKMIRQCVLSCLTQSYHIHQILVVDDFSTDKTPEILSKFGDEIEVVRTPSQTGNKSRAQEFGLDYVTGDIMITTDGDTILDRDFVKNVVKDFEDENVAAVAGYVKSLKYNWLTACRELDYVLGQNLHKTAQGYMNYIYVIPGCAAAFRVSHFKKYITFEHDTVTEDLDFTFRFHKYGLKIVFNKKAISYTQDPPNLLSYIRQMKRWYGGGWQCLRKHIDITKKPVCALELSLVYVEGIVSTVLFFLMPLINFEIFKNILFWYFIIILLIGIYASIKDKRIDLLIYSPLYFIVNVVNSILFLSIFVREVVIGKKNMFWYKSDRVKIC